MGQGQAALRADGVTPAFPTLSAARGEAVIGAGTSSVSSVTTHDPTTTVSSPRNFPTPPELHQGHGSGDSNGSGAPGAHKTPRSAASSLLSPQQQQPSSRTVSRLTTRAAQAALAQQRRSIMDAHYGARASGIVGAGHDHHSRFVFLALQPGDINKAAPASRNSSCARPEEEGTNGSREHRSSSTAVSSHWRPSELRDATVFAAAEKTMTLPTGELDCMASGFLSISHYGFVAEVLKTVSVFMLADMGVTDLGQPGSSGAASVAEGSPRSSDVAIDSPPQPHPPKMAGTAHSRTTSLSAPPRHVLPNGTAVGSTKPAWAVMRDALVAGKRGVPQPGQRSSLMDTTMTMIGGGCSDAAAEAAMQAQAGGSSSTTAAHLFRASELDGEAEGDDGRSSTSLTRAGTNSSCAGVTQGAGGSGVVSSTTAEGDGLASATNHSALGETAMTTVTPTTTEVDGTSIGLSPVDATEVSSGAATQPPAAPSTPLVSSPSSMPLVGVLPLLGRSGEAAAAGGHAGQAPSRLLFPHSPSHPRTGFARPVAVAHSPPPAPPPRPLSMSDLAAIAEQDEVLDLYLRTLAKRVRGITNKLRVMKPRSVLRFFLMSALTSAKGGDMAKLLPVTASVAVRPPGFADEAGAEAEVADGTKAVWILKKEVVLPSMSAAEVRAAQARSDALGAMGGDLVKFFKDSKAVTLRYILLFANAMPLSINSRLNHDYLLPVAAITESYIGCGVHTRRNKDFFVSLSDRVALMRDRHSFGTPECLLLGITQMSNLASQIMSSFAIGAVLGCTSRWRALHEAGLTSSEDVVDAMERFATAYCAGHDLLMNEAFPALRKQYPNVFIISSYSIKEEDGGRPPMMTVVLSTLMKLIFLFAGGLESIRADDRRLLATALGEERERLGRRLSNSPGTSLCFGTSDTSARIPPPTTTAAAARAAAASGVPSASSHAFTAPGTAPSRRQPSPSSLPASYSTDYDTASSSSMPRTSASHTVSPVPSGGVRSARGQSQQRTGSPVSQTGTASIATPRPGPGEVTAGRGFGLICSDAASGETCSVGDDVALSLALQVPSASLIVSIGDVLLNGPLAHHASLEDSVRAARALSRVWRVLFQTAGLLPFGPACPLEMTKWLPLFPLYTLSTDAKRVMLTVYAKSVGQTPLAFGSVQREDAVTSSAQIAQALYRASEEKRRSMSQLPLDTAHAKRPSALHLGSTASNAEAVAAAAAAAVAPAGAPASVRSRSHLICPTFTVTPGGAAHGGAGHAYGVNGKAHQRVSPASPRMAADLARAHRKELYELCARQCADPFLPGVNVTKELYVFALPGGVTMLRPERLLDRSPAQVQRIRKYGDRLTLIVARRRASMQRASGVAGSADASAVAPATPAQSEATGGVALRTPSVVAAEAPDAPVHEGDEVTLRWGEPSRSRSPATPAAAVAAAATAAHRRSSAAVPGSVTRRRASTGGRGGHSEPVSPQHLHVPQPWAPVTALFSAHEFVDPNKAHSEEGGTHGGDAGRHAHHHQQRQQRGRLGNRATAAPATPARTPTAAVHDEEAGALKEHKTASASALPTPMQRAALLPRRTCSASTVRPLQQQPQQHPFLRLGVQASGSSVACSSPRDAVPEAAEVMSPPPTRRSRVCLVLRTTNPNYYVVVLDTPNCVAGCASAVSAAVARASLVGGTTAGAPPSPRRPSMTSLTASIAGCVPSVTGVLLHRRHVAPFAALRSSSCAWTNPDFAARLCGGDGGAALHDAPLTAGAAESPREDGDQHLDGASSSAESVAAAEVLGWLLGQALGNHQTFTLPLPPLAFRILGMADRLELPVEAVPLTAADASLLHPDFTNARLREKLLATQKAMLLRPDPAATAAAAGDVDAERSCRQDSARSATQLSSRTLMEDECVSGSPVIARRQHKRLKRELEAITHAVMWSATAGDAGDGVPPGRHFWAAVLRGVQHSPLLDTPLFAQCCARTVRAVLCGPYDHLDDAFTFCSSFVLLVADDAAAQAAAAPSAAAGGGGEGYRQFVCKSVLRVLDELPLRERRVLLRFITGHSLRTRRSQMETLHLVVQRGFSSMPVRRGTTHTTVPSTRSATSAFSHPNPSPLTGSIAGATTSDATDVLGDADSRSRSVLSLHVNTAVETVVRTCVDGTVQLLPTGHPGTNTLVIPNYFEALLMGSYRQRVLGAALPPLLHGAATLESGSPVKKAPQLGATASSVTKSMGTAATTSSALGAAAARVAAGSPLGPVFEDAELQQAWAQLSEKQQETLRRRYRELLRHRLRAALYVYLMAHGDTVAEAWELGPEMGFTPHAAAAGGAGSPTVGGAAVGSGVFMRRPDGTVVFIERDIDDGDGSSLLRGDADGFVGAHDVDDGASEEFELLLATTNTETLESGPFAAFNGEEDAAAAGHTDGASRGDPARRMSLLSDPFLGAPASPADSLASPGEPSLSDGNLHGYRTAADFQFSDEDESGAGGGGDGDGEEAADGAHAEGNTDPIARAAPRRQATPEPVTVVPRVPPIVRRSVEDEAEAVLAEAATPRSQCSSTTTPSSAHLHAPTTLPPIAHAEGRRLAAPAHRPASGLLGAAVPMAVAPPRRPSKTSTPRTTLLQHARTSRSSKGSATARTPRDSGSSSGVPSKLSGSVAVQAAPETLPMPPPPPATPRTSATSSEVLLRAEIDSCIRDLFPEKAQA